MRKLITSLLLVSTPLGVEYVSCVAWSPNLYTKKLTNVIARQEGFFHAGTLLRRLNNPGALVYTHQRGATPGTSRFARFETPEAGWNAAYRDNEIKINRGMTTTDIIRRRSSRRDDVKRYLHVVHEAGL